MTLSFFVAPLRCARCGAAAPATIETSMQHQLGDQPWSEYRIGDALPSTPSRLAGAFLRTKAVEDGPIRILQDWICPACGTLEWAEVVVEDGRIKDIQAVPLTRSLLQRVHYVSEALVEPYAELVGPLFDGIEYDPDFAQKLAGKLPE